MMFGQVAAKDSAPKQSLISTPAIVNDAVINSTKKSNEQPQTYLPITDRNVINQNASKIAIIIDDIGYSRIQGLKAMALPGAITYAIIPHSPNAHFFALEAQKNAKEIMLHAPMSNVHDIPLGKNGLTETMTEADFKQTLDTALNSLPNVSGVNNHMGSLLTQKSLPMEWLMESLHQHQLYFIDSRTTSNSVAWKIAQDLNIPSLKRDIFLDHEATSSFIKQQFTKLTTLAKNRGYAVAIAHPYPETIAYLQSQLPLLRKQGIELVSVSELVRTHSPNLLASKSAGNVINITENILE